MDRKIDKIYIDIIDIDIHRSVINLNYTFTSPYKTFYFEYNCTYYLIFVYSIITGQTSINSKSFRELRELLIYLASTSFALRNCT